MLHGTGDDLECRDEDPGRSDPGLTPRGEAQSLSLLARLKINPFDHLYEHPAEVNPYCGTRGAPSRSGDP